MGRDCKKGCKDPETINDAIECDGVFTAQDCVYLKEHPYLEITAGDKLGKLIDVITSRFKSIARSLNRKVDYYTLYKDNNFYANDADASAGGVNLGEPYIDINGFLRVRIV